MTLLLNNGYKPGLLLVNVDDALVFCEENYCDSANI